jgi:hypothetical protein
MLPPTRPRIIRVTLSDVETELATWAALAAFMNV